MHGQEPSLNEMLYEWKVAQVSSSVLAALHRNEASGGDIAASVKKIVLTMVYHHKSYPSALGNVPTTAIHHV